jgi:hypothetical protein
MFYLILPILLRIPLELGLWRLIKLAPIGVKNHTFIWLFLPGDEGGLARISHQLLRNTAVDDPPDAPTHHRGISANTPQPRYSRV